MFCTSPAYSEAIPIEESSSYSMFLLRSNKNKSKYLLLDHLIVPSGASFYIMTFDKPVFPPG